MTMITFRPDLRTAGGEVTELLANGRFVGAIALVYREGERLSGSVQLDSESLAGRLKDEAIEAARSYVEQTADALGVADCEVIVTCSVYDHIIAGRSPIELVPEVERYDRFVEEDEARLNDIDPDDTDTIEMDEDDSEEDEPAYAELVIVGESRNKVEYHIYGSDREWLAEVFVRISGANAFAEIDWKYEPDDDEIEYIADLLVSDFDPDEVDTFRIDMKLDGETFETFELTREDLLEEADDQEEENEDIWLKYGDERDYSVILVRDDGDTLTYDLYKQSHGGLPIGQATIDISSRELTGFIDFGDLESSVDREAVGALLMRELEKERDYSSLNLTMLVDNELIDEIWYETELFH